MLLQKILTDTNPLLTEVASVLWKDVPMFVYIVPMCSLNTYSGPAMKRLTVIFFPFINLAVLD